MDDPSVGLEEGKIIARFPPTIWLRIAPLLSLLLFAIGVRAAGNGQVLDAVMLFAVGSIPLLAYLVDYRVFEVTERGVRVVRFGRARFHAFENMGRLLGTEVTQVPVFWTSAGTGRSTSYCIDDREGNRMFRVGLTTGHRQDLLRRIREGKRRLR